MRYLIGFFITIGLIILLIILLVRGGNNTKVPNTTKPLYSYSTTDSTAIMTINGLVNADSLHQKVRISVNRDNVTYEQINGYDDGVINQKIFNNTTEAYDTFLHALEHAGFTKGDTNKDLADPKGYCPTGKQYIFEFTNAGQSLERFWGTDCGSPHTYNGNLGLTVTLFEAQVPDYATLTSNIRF